MHKLVNGSVQVKITYETSARNTTKLNYTGTELFAAVQTNRRAGEQLDVICLSHLQLMTFFRLDYY